MIVAVTVAGGAAGYYALLPDELGPGNASPPPEAFGLMFGAFVGFVLATAAVAFARTSDRFDWRPAALAAGLATVVVFFLIDAEVEIAIRAIGSVFVAGNFAVAAGLGIVIGEAGRELAARRRHKYRSNNSARGARKAGARC